MNWSRTPFFQFAKSRFQRLFTAGSQTWGDAPGWYEARPWRLNLSGDGAGWNECVSLALNTNDGEDLFSAKGATLINSLGQRPRISGTGKSLALKARFIPGICP
jgi:hypothetical protein